MTRPILCAVGISVILSSLYVIGHPHSELAYFMDYDRFWSNIRVGGALLAMVFALAYPLRIKVVRVVTGALAMVALAVGLLSLISIYLRVIDTFILMCGGTYTLLAAIELPGVHYNWERQWQWKLRMPQLPQYNFTMARIWLSMYTHRRSVA